MADQIITDIISTIEDSIAQFQEKIPGIQDRVFSELQTLIKELDTKQGNITANLKNLKLIGDIKNRIEKIIVDPDYVEAVKKFIEAFHKVEDLQSNYFSYFNDKYKPKQTLKIVKQLAIDATLNGLLDSGLSVNIIDGLAGILQKNITTGGSYSSLSEQLRDHILTNNTGEGSLEKYSKQITTDALNQYSAQYQDLVSKDLGFNWGRYVGSNIKTTRELCEWLTKKDWVHRSELPQILKGHIDGHQCRIYQRTGLPYGMIPNTNVSNFNIYRGGYNCGHQFFWQPDSAVPKTIREKFAVATAAQDKIFNDANVVNVNAAQYKDLPQEIKTLINQWSESSNFLRDRTNDDPGKVWFANAVSNGVTQFKKIYRGEKYFKDSSYQANLYSDLKEGMTVGKVIKFGANFQVNKNTSYDLRFLSGTYDKKVATDFSSLKLDDFHSVNYTITSKTNIKGLLLGSLSSFIHEKEVVFGDEHSYQVIKSIEKKGNLFVELEQLQ